MFHQFIHYWFSVIFFHHQHSIFPMNLISFSFYFLYFFNSTYCFNISQSIIFDRFDLSLFEFKCFVINEFLSLYLPIGFGPFYFFWIMFRLEMSMTLRSAKLEYFAIISHELNTVTRIYRRPTEIALFYSHLYKLKTLINL